MVSQESTFVRLETIDRKYKVNPKHKPLVTDKEAYLEYMTKKLEWFNAKFFLLKELYQADI